MDTRLYTRYKEVIAKNLDRAFDKIRFMSLSDVVRKYVKCGNRRCRRI